MLQKIQERSGVTAKNIFAKWSDEMPKFLERYTKNAYFHDYLQSKFAVRLLEKAGTRLETLKIEMKTKIEKQKKLEEETGVKASEKIEEIPHPEAIADMLIKSALAFHMLSGSTPNEESMLLRNEKLERWLGKDVYEVLMMELIIELLDFAQNIDAKTDEEILGLTKEAKKDMMDLLAEERPPQA